MPVVNLTPAYSASTNFPGETNVYVNNFYGGQHTNNVADTINVDLSGLGTIQANNGVELLITIFADPLDTVNITLPPGWTLTAGTTGFITGGGVGDSYGTYFLLRDASGNAIDSTGHQINGGAATNTFWIGGTQTGDPTVNVTCFCSGTKIQCADGREIKVENLKPGDLVVTKDFGLMPVKKISKTFLDKDTLDKFPHLKPIVIDAGVFGNHDQTKISPQHRICVDETMFSGISDERLAPAKQLVGLVEGVRVEKSCDHVEYYHVMFDSHQLIMGDGMWSESFSFGRNAMAAMDSDQLREIEELFPHLTSNNGAELVRSEIRGHKLRKAIKMSM